MEAAPSSSGRPFTRSQRKRPASGAAGGTPLIKSPLLSDFFMPEAKRQARTAAPSLRAVRKRGGVPLLSVPQLTGYLGVLPEEVSVLVAAGHHPRGKPSASPSASAANRKRNAQIARALGCLHLPRYC